MKYLKKNSEPYAYTRSKVKLTDLILVYQHKPYVSFSSDSIYKHVNLSY